MSFIKVKLFLYRLRRIGDIFQIVFCVIAIKIRRILNRVQEQHSLEYSP